MRNIKNELFENIVENYYKLVYKVCFDVLKDTYEAENISQDTFLSFYKNFNKYSSLKPNELKNLICKIALNKCKDLLKSCNFRLVSSIEENNLLLPNTSYEDSIEESLIKKEKLMLIKKTINELKSPYKEIIIDYYFNNLTLDEMSKKLKRDKNVIKTQLYRSKKLLKNIMKGEDLFE